MDENIQTYQFNHQMMVYGTENVRVTLRFEKFEGRCPLCKDWHQVKYLEVGNEFQGVCPKEVDIFTLGDPFGLTED